MKLHCSTRGLKHAPGILANPRMHAFTLWDLVVCIAVLAGAIAFMVLTHTGERGRGRTCAANLHKIGKAMNDFAEDHGNAIPPAAVLNPQHSWDNLIKPYMRPDLVKPGSAYAERQLKEATSPVFSCPSDPLTRSNPRSYAMSAHDMHQSNWPPGPENNTGVGLRWTKEKIQELLGQGSSPDNAVQSGIEAFSRVKFQHLTRPADTLLFTEFIEKENKLGDINKVRITSSANQLEYFKTNSAGLHGKRFSYLMADGHVELLSPARTRPPGDSAGIWTIRTGD